MLDKEFAKRTHTVTVSQDPLRAYFQAKAERADLSTTVRHNALLGSQQSYHNREGAVEVGLRLCHVQQRQRDTTMILSPAQPAQGSARALVNAAQGPDI